MSSRRIEAAIGAAVSEWFRSKQAVVYEEVIDPRPSCTERADLVAVETLPGFERTLVHIVECKAELSFELLAQARHWSLNRFGCVWLAVPKLHRSSVGRAEAIRIAHAILGFGVLVVDREVSVEGRPANLHPPEDRRLLDSLRPEHQTHAKAGSPSGGHFTSFKASCQALSAYVKENDGCRLEDAVKTISHHYRSTASAVSSLHHWVREGKVDGVYPGWKGRLYNTPRASAQSMMRQSA